MSVLAFDKKQPTKIETATFALGCFWGPDAKFGSLPGVVRTRVGYAGGKKKHPTYYLLGGHTETVQIDFNPKMLSYEDLLHIYWESHDPQHKSLTKQYRNIIFVMNSEQEKAAGKRKKKSRNG